MLGFKLECIGINMKWIKRERKRMNQPWSMVIGENEWVKSNKRYGFRESEKYNLYSEAELPNSVRLETKASVNRISNYDCWVYVGEKSLNQYKLFESFIFLTLFSFISFVICVFYKIEYLFNWFCTIVCD